MKTRRMEIPGSRWQARPNKVAKGMQYTWERTQAYARARWSISRRHSSLSDDAVTLCVRGTFDRLGIHGLRVRKVCPCCEQRTGKYALSARGRRYLDRLRRHRDVMRAPVQSLNPYIRAVTGLDERARDKFLAGLKRSQ